MCQIAQGLLPPDQLFYHQIVVPVDVILGSLVGEGLCGVTANVGYEDRAVLTSLVIHYGNITILLKK